MLHLVETGVVEDLDEGKITRLKDGIIPIYEPGHEPLVKSNYESGRLKFTTDMAEAVKENDRYFVTRKQ